MRPVPVLRESTLGISLVLAHMPCWMLLPGGLSGDVTGYCSDSRCVDVRVGFLSIQMKTATFKVKCYK